MNVPALIKSIPYFSKMELPALKAYAESATLLHLNCDEVLFHEGEVGEDACILLDGRLKATVKTADGTPKIIGEIGRGEIVGETAVLLERPRGATVSALRHSILIRIKKEELLDLIQQQDGSILEMTKTIIERTDKTFAHKRTISSVMLLPLSKSNDLGDFSRQLGQALLKHGPVKLLSTEVFTAETKVEITERTPVSDLVPHLAEYESNHPLLVYVGTGAWNNWMQACSGRVDKVMMVGEEGQSPLQSRMEKALGEHLNKVNRASIDLVLLHQGRKGLPSGTQEWLSMRKVERHYHLVKGEEAGFQKLARFLTGNAIGLALSGGGFRSSMQAGIIHAMMEGGIPIDIIGGSSGGAFAGAHFAMNPPLESIHGAVMGSMAKFSKVMKFTLPMISLFSGKRFTKGFVDFFGESQLEDLWTHFFCLSLSLVNGKINVHQNGPIWEAVRASSSVMGLFPPVLKDGDCLVDGGFINPCPTDILHELGAGKIVVVSAFSKGGIKVDGHFSPATSGWKILWKKLNPFYRQKIVPNIGTNIMQSMFMASDHLLQGVFSKSKIDLFIEPKMEGYTSRDGGAIEVFYKYGYQYGKDRIEEWKDVLGLSD